MDRSVGTRVPAAPALCSGQDVSVTACWVGATAASSLPPCLDLHCCLPDFDVYYVSVRISSSGSVGASPAGLDVVLSVWQSSVFPCVCLGVCI